MKNKTKQIFQLLIVALTGTLFMTACGSDEGGETFTEADYVGTYIGAHVVADPFILNIITGIDSTQDGSFADTIVVSSGTDPNDNIMEFTSQLLNGSTVQANISITSGGNVTAINFGTLVLGDEDPIEVTNAQVKASSSIRPSGGNTFNARLNVSGTINVGTPINIPNLSTTGVFTKQ